jgi:hypothetical protein
MKLTNFVGERLFLLLASLVIGGFLSVVLGQDANWDLKNYHLYNPWAYFQSRLSIDLFAAGTQSYFSPILDIPYYMLSTQWFPNQPRLVAFVMGLPYGFLIFMTVVLSRLVIAPFVLSPMRRFFLATVVTGFGVSGVATISQVGTTFNEVVLAAIIVNGLFFIIDAVRQSNSDKKSTILCNYFILSGLLFGAAAGLKLTACIYAPGAAVAIFFVNGSMKQRLARVIIFSTAWCVSFFVFWGAWAVSLYKLTNNPFFPLLNSIFQSPWITSSGGLDLRFLPENFLEFAFYPFFWSVSNSMTVMEPSFSDPRFALAYSLLIIFLLSYLPKLFIKPQKNEPPVGSNMVLNCILIFFIISYVIWQSLFSILRYAVVLESILGVLMFSLLMKIFYTWSIKKVFESSFLIISIAFLYSAFMTSYPNWGRVEFSDNVFDINTPKVPSNSLILLLGKPIAYLAPFLAVDNQGVEFIGIADNVLDRRDFLLTRKVDEKINGWSGDIFYVARKETISSSHILEKFSLYPKGECSGISSNIDESAYLCGLSKLKTLLPWPTFPQSIDWGSYSFGEKIFVSSAKNYEKYLIDGWSQSEIWGVWSDSDRASIKVKIPQLVDQDVIFQFSSHSFLTPGHAKLNVRLYANGVPLEDFEYAYPRDLKDWVREVKIPNSLFYKNEGILRISFKIMSPASPLSLMISGDARRLGLGMVWFNLHPGPAS